MKVVLKFSLHTGKHHISSLCYSFPTPTCPTRPTRLTRTSSQVKIWVCSINFSFYNIVAYTPIPPKPKSRGNHCRERIHQFSPHHPTEWNQQISKQTNRQTNKQTHKQIHKLRNRQSNRLTDKQTNKYTN